MDLPLPPQDRWALRPSALAGSTSAAGGCDCDATGVVQLERLSFASLDEPLLIQMRLEQRKREQQRDRWIGRVFGAGVALTTGVCVDGFDVADLTGAVMGGVIGDLAADGLNQLSDQELDRLDLRWALAPDSLQYHQRRHGQPLHRVLLLAIAHGSRLRSTAAVRFADGFLAFFSPEPFRCDLAPFNGTRRLSGRGAMPEPGSTPSTVAELPCSDGRCRPLQALLTDQGPLLAMQLATPHHSLY